MPLDTQSYIKTIIATHYDKKGVVQSRALNKDNSAYLYALFENEVPVKDYQVALELLIEYFSTISSEELENSSESPIKF